MKTGKTEYVTLSYPHNRPGPSRPDLRASDIKTGLHIRDFNQACPSVCSMSKLDWSLIRAIGKSDCGTGGVIFLENEEGALAIKGSKEIAVEYFSNLLFRALKVSIPEMKLVKWNEKEFKEIQENIDRSSFERPEVNRIVRARMNCPFLLVMGYVPSITIKEIGEKRAKHIFDPNYPSSRDRLIRLGMIISTDTFINNCDRYPLIWRGPDGEETQGNPDNLLIRVETDFLSSSEAMKDPNNMDFGFGSVFAIDNRPNLLRKDDNMTVNNLIKFHKEFEKMLKELFEELKQVKEAKLDPIIDSEIRFRSIEKITSFIFRQTNYRLKSMSQFQIMLGMVLQYVNILEMGSLRIQAIYRDIYPLAEDDWKDVWKNSFSKINLEFLEDTIGLIRKYLMTNDEIVLWVKSITLQQYIIKWSEEDEKESYLLKGSFKGNNKGLEKNIENFLRIEENLDEWELKDSGNVNEENEKDKQEFERERELALKKLRNQQIEKNMWLDGKMREIFQIDPEGVKKQREEEDKSKIEKEKEDRRKEEQEFKKKEKDEKEKRRVEESEKERKRLEEEENKKKGKGWMSFFTKKTKKDTKK